MYQKLDFALGFFITVVFLASVVVGLTMIYISRSKPQIQEEKNGKEMQTIETVKLEEKCGRIDKSDRSNSEDLEVDHKTESYVKLFMKFFKVPLSSKPAPEVNISLNETNSSEKKAVDIDKSVSKRIIVNDKGSLNSPVIPDRQSPISQFNSISEKEKTHQINTENRSPSIVNILNSSTQPAGITSSIPLVAEGKMPEVVDIEPNKGTQPEKGETVAEPAISVENKNEVKEPMVNQSQESRPTNPKPDMGFSELFTEDTEESEASKLVKELPDVDTSDILEMSQNLVSQFRRRNPLSNGEN